MYPELGGGPPTQLALSTTSAIAVRACYTRKKLVLCNNTLIDIWLSRSDSAVVNAGILLQASGGSLVDEPDTWGRIYMGPWSAIAASGTPILSISEDR